MALTAVKLSINLQWAQEFAISGFNPSRQSGPLDATIAPTVGASDAREIYFVQGTLAAGASVTFSLRAFTEPAFNRVLTGTGAYILVVTGTGATWKYEPGAANPLEWFLGGTTPAINGTDASAFAYGADDAVTVSATDDTVKLTNTHGSDTLTYRLAAVIKTA